LFAKEEESIYGLFVTSTTDTWRRKQSLTKAAGSPNGVSRKPNELHTHKSGVIAQKEIFSFFGNPNYAGHAGIGIDQPVGACIFPNGEPRTRAFPGIEHFSGGVLAMGNPSDSCQVSNS
jgi:hypothetical protein